VTVAVDPQETVLVLGAGASKPYGFPTGDELVHEICGSFGAEVQSLGAREVQRRAFGEQVREFLERLRGADTDNIDTFLQRNPSLDRTGRLAVAMTILGREKPTALNPQDEHARREHWYKYLWNRIAPDDPRHIASTCPRIITFNYDRSLEEYLFRRLPMLYSWVDSARAAEYLRILPIVHVHGRTGRLPWQEGADEPIDYGYGSGDRLISRELALMASEGIKIVGAASPSEAATKTARDWLREARVIGFLGFGYEKANVELLFRGLSLSKDVVINGSAFGLTDARKEQAVKQLHSLLGTDDETRRISHRLLGIQEFRSAISRRDDGSWRFATPNRNTVTVCFGDNAHGNLEFLDHSPHLLRG